MSDKPKTDLDYRGLLDAFAKTAAQAVAEAGDMWQWPERMHEPAATGKLTEQLKAIYAHNIKNLFAQWHSYPRLEEEIGQLFGALVCHLQALHLRWNTFAPAGKAGHRFIKMNELSEALTNDALAEARRLGDLAGQCVARLLREEAQLRSRVELFCSLLKAHCDRNKIGAERSGHPIYGFHIADITFTTHATIVSIHFSSFDGVDLFGAGIGTLIGTNIGTEDADRLARRVFGQVFWSEGKNGIKFVPDLPAS